MAYLFLNPEELVGAEELVGVAGGPISTIPDMPETKLLKTVERWLRSEKETTREKAKTSCETSHETRDAVASRATAPSFPSKHMAYFS